MIHVAKRNAAEAQALFLELQQEVGYCTCHFDPPVVLGGRAALSAVRL
jgi:hypothetical protein